MDRLVVDHYPASKLPDDLRGRIQPSAVVKVTIEELPKQNFAKEELGRQLAEVRRSLEKKVTVEEAVARIRQLRDEWDD